LDHEPQRIEDEDKIERLMKGRTGASMANEKAKPFIADNELAKMALHFKLFGEPMRLRILQAVRHEPRTVGDIVSALGAKQANVSKHLALLARMGIVARKKVGLRAYYGLEDSLALKMCELAHNHWAEQACSV
jgi:ArsR family transcriptional regulator